jgi:hypothetical protein
MFNIGKVVNYYQRGMNHHSIITISCFFVVIISVYAISTIITTTTIDAAVIAITTSITTSMPIEQLQKRPNGESDENEPITDLPIIDSPCKSSCSPNYKLCLYICKSK